MIDTGTQLRSVTRSVETREAEGKPARAVILRQAYDTSLAELWDAVTNAERIPHWFAPVEGELTLNGRFQVKDNAAGTITFCEPEAGFDATWEFGDDMSWIEVRLTPEGLDRSTLQLAHITHPNDHWNQYGPGATGIGWDLSLLGLATHLATGNPVTSEAAEWGTSPEAIEFCSQSGKAWIEADIASGKNHETAETRGQNTIAFYTGASEGEE